MDKEVIKNMTVRIISIILLQLILVSNIFAEVITLKSGETINAKIINQDEQSVTIDFYGSTVVYYYDDIKDIDGVDISANKNKAEEINTLYRSAIDYGLKGDYVKAEEGIKNILNIYKYHHPSETILNLLISFKNSDVSKEYVDLIFRGLDYFDKKEYVFAEQDFQKAIDINPKIVFAYGLLGTVYFYNAQYDDSVFIFEKALQINPKDINYYSVLSTAYIKDKKLDLALKTLNKMLEIDSQYWPIYSNFGMLYVEEEKYQDAVKAYERAISLGVGFLEPYVGLARVYYYMGNYEKSIEITKKALFIDSSDSSPYTDLGLCYYALKDYKRSVDYFEKAKLLGPEIVNFYYPIAIDYMYLNDYDKALENFKKAREVYQKNNDTDMLNKVDKYINYILSLKQESND